MCVQAVTSLKLQILQNVLLHIYPITSAVGILYVLTKSVTVIVTVPLSIWPHRSVTVKVNVYVVTERSLVVTLITPVEKKIKHTHP
jgi:hypothetical protein